MTHPCELDLEIAQEMFSSDNAVLTDARFIRNCSDSCPGLQLELVVGKLLFNNYGPEVTRVRASCPTSGLSRLRSLVASLFYDKKAIATETRHYSETPVKL